MQMSLQESVAAFRADRPQLEERGVFWEPGAEPMGYVTDAIKRDYTLAMDAISTVPILSTGPNSAVPAMLTTFIDPQVYEILFAPNMAAEIMGEVRKGTWVDDTIMFPVAEATGEVSSYGDFNNNARSGVNINWPQVQSYSFQTIKEYGERALARVGLARVNFVTEIDRAAALNLNKFANFVYFFGINGLQNYGLINNPFLGASLTPATKAAGGVTWFTAGGSPNATANEVYNDILAVITQLVKQNAGLVTPDSPMTMAIGPTTAMALNFANTFNVNVETLLKTNFPQLKIKRAIQYDSRSSLNTQGSVGGGLFQIIVDSVEGQKVGFMAYSEKMRSFPIIRMMSAFKQKIMSGVWGCILRYPAGVASMIGV